MVIFNTLQDTPHYYIRWPIWRSSRTRYARQISISNTRGYRGTE